MGNPGTERSDILGEYVVCGIQNSSEVEGIQKANDGEKTALFMISFLEALEILWRSQNFAGQAKSASHLIFKQENSQSYGTWEQLNNSCFCWLPYATPTWSLRYKTQKLQLEKQ